MASKKSGKIVGPSSGAAATGAANVPGTPTFVANGTGTISITWDENSNASVVTYCIYVEESGSPIGYVQPDMTVDSGEAWQTFNAWGGATITITGLTIYTPYKFKVKAKDEATIETAYSSLSATMNTLPDLDKGPTSDTLEREVTGGDTRVYGDPTWDGDLADVNTDNSYYGDILFTYVLQNQDSESSSIGVQFSEDYDEETETGTWAAATEGSGGDGTTGLDTSVAGESHVYSFDSDASCGASDKKDAVYLKITPYDADSDAGTAAVIGPFGVNNLPAKMTWTSEDGKTWNKDDTPTFIADMPSLRTATLAYPAIHYYREEDGATATADKYGFESIDGWEYETDTDVWTALTVAGIDAAYCGIGLRVRYTPPSALATGNYIVTGEMWENRDT